MRQLALFLVIAASGLVVGCGSTPSPAEPSIVSDTLTTRTADELHWGALNPKRGAKGPRAATLWGDRTQEGPSGFLVRFVDGFASPPHIHNVSYRALVIHGLIHNADPDATRAWMSPGSYWTQPRGGVHITAAQGDENVVYVEIDEGPYLVQPPTDAFDSGEAPINVDARNLVWQAPNEAAAAAGGLRLAWLWGRPDDSGEAGALVRVPAGFAGHLHAQQKSVRMIVVAGRIDIDGQPLTAGDTARSTGVAPLELRGANNGDSVVYVRTTGHLAFP